jgi:hypothetical protein
MAKKKDSARRKREFDRILRDKFGGDLSKMKAAIADKSYQLPGRLRTIMGDTERRQDIQTNSYFASGLGKVIRDISGGIDDPKFDDVAAFGALSDVLFPDSTFSDMEQDPEAKALAGKFEGNLDKQFSAVDKGLGSIDTQEQMLTPELQRSLSEVAKGAVNDPTLMLAAEQADRNAADFMRRADAERQIDPAQQAVLDELMLRSKGFTPEEQAAYQGQMETAIARNNQAAMRNAAAAGARGIRGGLASDLQYRAGQDALAQRAQGGQQMILTGRELGDQALEQAGNVAGTAVGQARQGYGTFAGLGAQRQQDTGNILHQAVQSGLDKYGHNITRSNNAAGNLGNLNTARTGLVNAGSGAANAASGFFNPYLGNRHNVSLYNKELPFRKGQVKGNFILGGLGYGTEREQADEAKKYARDVISLMRENANKAPPSNTTNITYSAPAPGGTDAGLK